MKIKVINKYLLIVILTTVSTSISAQENVPLGIYYQAVARDNTGKELATQKINVRFSIIPGGSTAAPVYQEVHDNVLTSPYGVFSLIIGEGVSTGDYKAKNLSEVMWQSAAHFLKVEVQFPRENDFTYMATMKFLAVPYALYAQKSLEPGPPGPKGDPGPQGDPASDKQTLSVVNIDGSDYLAISGGNQVKVSSIEKDGDPTNELQDLVYDNAKMELRVTKSTPVIDLSALKNDADADPTNEIQDLQLAGNILKITGKTDAASVNLTPYLDNTDNQQLSYSEATNTLSITNGTSVTLGTMVAFRAKKTTSTTVLPMAYIDFIPDNIEYNDGNGLNTNNGEFTANYTGIYSFDIKYLAEGNGKDVLIYKNGNLYEKLASGLSAGTIIYRTMTIKLMATDKIKMVIFTGSDNNFGTGTFSGYKAY